MWLFWGMRLLEVSFVSLFAWFLNVRMRAKLMRSLLHLSHQFENAAFILLLTCGQSGRTDKNASLGSSVSASSFFFTCFKGTFAATSAVTANYCHDSTKTDSIFVPTSLTQAQGGQMTDPSWCFTCIWDFLWHKALFAEAFAVHCGRGSEVLVAGMIRKSAGFWFKRSAIAWPVLPLCVQ